MRGDRARARGARWLGHAHGVGHRMAKKYKSGGVGCRLRAIGKTVVVYKTTSKFYKLQMYVVVTTCQADRTRANAPLRAFTTCCCTSAHFCKLSTQNVPFICSALQAPCMRCALPAALSTRLAQTVTHAHSRAKYAIRSPNTQYAYALTAD